MINHFVTTQNISFLDTIAVILILYGSPLNWHFKLIFAALTNPAQKVDNRIIEKHDSDHHDYLHQHESVDEDTVDIVIERFDVDFEENS